MIHIRPAIEKDVPAITFIYNDAILNSTATFDTEIKSEEDRLQWLRSHDEKHPVMVAEIEGVVVGWASLTRWSDRSAYDSTAESSVYVHPSYRKQGIGKTLMEVLVLEGKRAGLHSLLARITHGNEHSIYIHERLGYELVGTLKEVGVKFGTYQDVHMLQKIYS